MIDWTPLFYMFALPLYIYMSVICYVCIVYEEKRGFKSVSKSHSEMQHQRWDLYWNSLSSLSQSRTKSVFFSFSHFLVYFHLPSTSLSPISSLDAPRHCCPWQTFTSKVHRTRKVVRSTVRFDLLELKYHVISKKIFCKNITKQALRGLLKELYSSEILIYWKIR